MKDNEIKVGSSWTNTSEVTTLIQGVGMNITATEDHSSPILNSGIGGMHVYTTNQSSPTALPSGVTTVKVTVIGGGGGGGGAIAAAAGASAWAGGGGAAGGTVIAYIGGIVDSAPGVGALYTVTVGPGGVGVKEKDSPTNGSDSTFSIEITPTEMGVTVTAPGGAGAHATDTNISEGALGGLPINATSIAPITITQINIQGGAGGSNGPETNSGGAGGNSFFIGGGNASGDTLGVTGHGNPGLHGGGGSGAWNSNDAGGGGGSGIVVIEW